MMPKEIIATSYPALKKRLEDFSDSEAMGQQISPEHRIRENFPGEIEALERELDKRVEIFRRNGVIQKCQWCLESYS